MGNFDIQDTLTTPEKVFGENWQPALARVEQGCAEKVVSKISELARIPADQIKIVRVETKFLLCRDVRTSKYEYILCESFGDQKRIETSTAEEALFKAGAFLKIMMEDDVVTKLIEDDAQTHYIKPNYTLDNKSLLIACNSLFCNVTCAKCFGAGEIQCSACEGKGNILCGACGGRGKAKCSKCSGGKMTCSACNGYGQLKEYYHDAQDFERSRLVRCTECFGSGTTTCYWCNGSGEDTCNQCNGSGVLDCGECHGRGKVQCVTCQGKGFVPFIQTPSISMDCKLESPARDLTLPEEGWILTAFEKTGTDAFRAAFERNVCITDVAIASPAGDKTIRFVNGDIQAGINEAISVFTSGVADGIRKRLEAIGIFTFNAVEKINALKQEAMAIPWLAQILKGQDKDSGGAGRMKDAMRSRIEMLRTRTWIFAFLCAGVATYLISPAVPWTLPFVERLQNPGLNMPQIIILGCAAAAIWGIAAWIAIANIKTMIKKLKIAINKGSGGEGIVIAMFAGFMIMTAIFGVIVRR